MEKFDLLREKMKRRGIETLIGLSLDNATYLIGAMIPSHATSKKRRVLAVLPREREPILILAGMEETFARQHSAIRDIRVYREYAEDPIDFLGRTLKDLGLAGKRVGLEMEGMNARDFLKLKGYAEQGGFEIVDATELLEESRSVKTVAEMEILQRVCRISEETIAEVYSALRPGMTEKQVESLFSVTLSAKGGELKRARFGSGENTGVGNPVPSDRVLKEGDLFRVDFMGIVNNYYSDLARTGVLGKAETEHKDIWSRLYETHHKLLENIHPGVAASHLYSLYKKDFEKWGFMPAPMAGHCIGLVINEPPVLNAFTHTELAEGMVLCVEEYHIVKGVMGLHLEDMVQVTSKGCEVISNLMDPRFLIEVGI